MGHYLPVYNILVKKSEDSPLHLALVGEKTPSLKLIELLLKAGADPKSVNKDGSTPLHNMCNRKREDDELAKFFFKIIEENHEVVQIDAQDKMGNTPLHLALRRVNNLKLAELLLRRGADPTLVNEEGSTPLHIICNYQGQERVRIFFSVIDNIQKTVQLDVQDKLGNTPLHLALRCVNRTATELLLRRGANPNLANAEGLTPLHALSRYFCYLPDAAVARGILDNHECSESFFNIIDELNHTVQLDSRDKLGNTPLHLAAYWDNKKTIEILLRRGADPNSANEEGSTPLHNICKRTYEGYDGLLELFFKVNDERHQLVQVNARDKLGRTPLQWAVANLRPKEIDIILDRGADFSNFVFPTESYFAQIFDYVKSCPGIIKLELVARALLVVERLINRIGYELDERVALMIMKCFAKLSMFEKPKDHDEFWYDEQRFVIDSKKLMISPRVSLYDLIRLRPEEAAKLLTCEDYFQCAKSHKLLAMHGNYFDSCGLHLCEKLSRGFFRRWALDLFFKLIHGRLPIEICEMIIEQLMNEDLYNICVAATSQRS